MFYLWIVGRNISGLLFPAVNTYDILIKERVININRGDISDKCSLMVA